jgi:hypothetical protein
VDSVRLLEQTDILKDGLSGFPFKHPDLCEPICIEKEPRKPSANAKFANPEGLAGPMHFRCRKQMIISF